MTTTIQRIENGAIAVAIVLATLAFGHPWWMLLVAFLAFDLSALGYVRGPRIGAIVYNAVHNYTGPAIAFSAYLVFVLAGVEVTWLVIVAECWAFHVAVDRALGYGLKQESFQHTHLGRIGRARRTNTRTDTRTDTEDPRGTDIL